MSIAVRELKASLSRVLSRAQGGEIIEVTRLRADWPRYAIVEITQPLMEVAGEYADTFALRGYDSVQLAAARSVQQAAGEEPHFACFDARLQKAARMLGMPTRA